jgi:hypothetical protein
VRIATEPATLGEASITARPILMLVEEWRLRRLPPRLRSTEVTLRTKLTALRPALSKVRISAWTTVTEEWRLRLLRSHLRPGLWRPLAKVAVLRFALRKTLPAIESSRRAEMPLMLIPSLRPTIARPWACARSVAAIVILGTRRWRGALAPLRVISSPLRVISPPLRVSLRCSVTASAAVLALRSEPLRPAPFKAGPALALAARLVRPRFSASQHRRIASGTESIRPCAGRTISIAAAAFAWRLRRIRRPSAGVGRTGLRIVSGATALAASLGTTVPLGPEFFGLQLAVAVPIQPAEYFRGAADLVGVEHAVMIRVEQIEQSAAHYRPAHAAAFLAGTAIAAAAGITLRSAIAGTAFARGAVSWSAVALWSIRWPGRGIVLGAKRPRRERERHGRGKYISGFHRWRWFEDEAPDGGPRVQ